MQIEHDAQVPPELTIKALRARIQCDNLVPFPGSG
jgi:hypothetical protein